MFRLFEESGFTRVRSAVVPRFRFRQQSTQNSAEAYGVKAVMLTALKPQDATVAQRQS
jgi:predicted secreted protein